MSSCGWVVASPPWRRGRHRQDGVGLTARMTTQSVHRSVEMAPSAPFWGICVHCCAVGLGCGWPWDRNSVHKWEDRASPHRIGAFVYTVGLLRCCGQTRGRNSVHRSTKMAPRCRFGAFVYTVASRVTIRIATRSAQGGTSASATMACRRRPLAGPLAWSGRQALREWRRCQVGIFAEASTHTNPRRARYRALSWMVRCC